jgi:septal ring factor EnvC (AmiA/AmiB activator)
VQASDFDEFEFIRIGDDTAFTFPYDTFIAGIQNRAVDAGANPHIVLVDDNGKLGTVAVNEIGIKTNAQAMLNEFLKEHKKVEELEATVAQQQKGMEVLTAQLKEQAAQIKKVSAQIEMSKPASKVVVNEP